MFNRSYLPYKKMEKRGQKELLTTLECLNYNKSSQQLPWCFIAMRDSPFRKMFSPLFCFEQGKTLKKTFRRNCIQLRKRKKKKEGRKVALGTIRYEAGMCIGLLSFLTLHKINRFHVTVGVFSDRSQRTSKSNSLAARVPLHCFYHILTSSVICYDPRHMESIC